MYFSVLKNICSRDKTNEVLFWHVITTIILDIYCWINAYEFEQHNDTGIWVLEIFWIIFFYHSSTCCNTQYQRARVLRPFRISNTNRVSNRIQQWWRRLLPLASHWILNTTSASTVGSSEGLCKNLTRQSSSLVRKKIRLLHFPRRTCNSQV